MWKQLKTNRNTNNVDITIRQFYDTFKRQSQPPALDMFDTNFMSKISKSRQKRSKILYFKRHSERKNYEK